MKIYPCQNFPKSITIIIFISCVISFSAISWKSFADTSSDPEDISAWQEEETEGLTVLQQQARDYRARGYGLQRVGNLDAAMSLYQKAIELDPLYAVAYNDLGVVYESKGFLDRAEDSYLKASKIDPNLLSAYSNLALIYENKRDLNKAAYYWEKRAIMGFADDPWTEKARQRFSDINLVLSKRPVEDMREQEVIGLLKDTEVHKSLLKKSDKELAKSYFKEAKRLYKSGNEVTALKIAIDAQQLDPANTEIEEFIEKVQRRILSK